MSAPDARRRRLAAAAGLVGAGLVAAAVLASLTGTSAAETATLLAFAGVGSLGATLAVVVLGRLGRARSLFGRLMVVVLVATTATATGVALSAQAMFISTHDLGVLAIVVAVAASLAGASAVLLSGRVADEAAELSRLARLLGRVDGPDGDMTAGEAGDEVTTPISITSAELRAVADELIEAHDRLTRSRRRADALDASRRELVAWVSHDLRSPITSVRAMAEALEDGVVADPESVARYHRTIRAETERLGQLVDDLFELSRISSGVAATADADLIALDELVLDVVEGADGHAHTRGVALAHRLAGAEPVLVPTDLRRVLRNLVDNAIAATGSGGTVTLVGRVEDDDVLALDVLDECGGIEEVHLPRVFDVGYRADGARRADDGGAGLGLAIARGLLEAHEGEITVANDGPGCRFRVRIPVRSES